MARILVAWIAVLLLGVLPAAAQSGKSLVWERLDCDISVQPNGDLRIVETNTIRFTSGQFSFGYRDIDMARLTDVTNISGIEAGKAMRLETGVDGSNYRIKFYFLTPAQAETRTFQLSYTVRGATRYYAQGDQVYWVCVYGARNGFPVQASKAVVRLPGNMTATAAETYGPKTRMNGQNETVITAETTESIPSGKEFEIRVQVPHGVLTGSAASWQKPFDDARQYDETVKPRNDLLAGVLGALALIVGPAGVFALWQTRGKDPNVGKIAEFLTEPPSDIPAGLAGTAIDETADLKDVLATMVDLARRGMITMREEAPEKSLLGFQRVSDWVIEAGDKLTYGDLAPYEQSLVSALQVASGAQTLSSLKNKFYARLPDIKKKLYEELVRRKLYNESPATVKNRYALFGALLLGAGLVSLFCLSPMLVNYTSLFFCVPAAIAITGLLLLIAAPAMPRATRAGAEAKARLVAFKRYLQNIERYTDLGAAKEQFDRYLPYAIAFGLESTFINKFSRVDAPMPPWYMPYDPYLYGMPGRGLPRTSHARGPMSPAQSAPDIGGAASAAGGLGGLNESMGRGLSSLNAGLTSMLNTVSTTMVSTPQPVQSSGSSSGGWSSGGWSGGGGGGGGGSGGGGGGWG